MEKVSDVLCHSENLGSSKKSEKCWGCNFSKDSDAHRSPLGEASGCFLSREQPAGVPRGEYLWIILIKKLPVHNGLIFLTCPRTCYREMSTFSCTQPLPGSQQLPLSHQDAVLTSDDLCLAGGLHPLTDWSCWELI